MLLVGYVVRSFLGVSDLEMSCLTCEFLWREGLSSLEAVDGLGITNLCLVLVYAEQLSSSSVI